MKVFVSWSGARSHQIALALRGWLPTVLPAVKPWVSSEDIPKGAPWTLTLRAELEATQFGIICLVPESLGESWIIFEAGAMSQSMDTARVAPLLVGAAIEDVPEPLAQYQCTVFEKEDVRKLMRSINDASGAPLDPQVLDETFDRRWPDLAGRIQGTESARPHGALVRERVVVPTAPHEDLFKEPGGLSKEQVAILTVLARNPGASPTASELASLMGENQTRTQYHLDGLKKRGLIGHRQLYASRPTTYYLTEAGRAYVVENNLI